MDPNPLPCGSSTSLAAPKDQKLATQFAQYAQQIFTLAGQSSFDAKVSLLPAAIQLCLCSVLTPTPRVLHTIDVRLSGAGHRALAGQDLPFSRRPPVGHFRVACVRCRVVFVDRACPGSDPYATYNNLTLAQLYALTPNIDQEAWDAYFTNAGLQIDGTQAPFSDESCFEL